MIGFPFSGGSGHWSGRSGVFLGLVSGNGVGGGLEMGGLVVGSGLGSGTVVVGSGLGSGTAVGSGVDRSMTVRV